MTAGNEKKNLLLRLIHCNRCHRECLLNIVQYFADCNALTGTSPSQSCVDDILTVSWPTDVTFDGTVSGIPAVLRKQLTDRLIEASRNPILDLVIVSSIPP